MEDTVIILHGIFLSNKRTESLADHLSGEGYHVININYASTKHSLSELCKLLWKEIKPLKEQAKTIHFIGYSMGGLLIRLLIKNHNIQNIGRVVFIGTPNHGSAIADIMKNNWLYKALYGPAGQEIGEKTLDKKALGSITYECGVIAGTKSLDPLCSLFLKSPHDGKVTVESTKVQGIQDHITIPTGHYRLPSHAETLSQTAYFLEHGEFLHM